MSSSSSKTSQARLREALAAGGHPDKSKGPPTADGVLAVTPDTPEAIEWRSRQSVVDRIAACSSFLDDDDGPQTSELYGTFTWRLDQFGEGGKRELRSNVFEVGSYKWYLLVYPHGCDVANHLSLFLCVADYDKLLPGWSHFAQFTIAVVNGDPKKSKYSDTLHRFCKKEHDWGWKKFMELAKIMDGFAAGDSLVIKAQVQVIRDRPQLPFRCLDAQYRRELVRVYLTNVEGIARRFVDEQREALRRVLDQGGPGPGGFRAFWRTLDPARQRQLSADAAPAVLKGVVKRFFNEKEVTSTLVMDALYCGAKLLEEAGRRWLEGRGSSSAAAAVVAPLAEQEQQAEGQQQDAAQQAAEGQQGAGSGVLIDGARGVFFFAGDAVSVLERAVAEGIPPFQSDKQSGELPQRTQDADDQSRDSIERDERRLADLGRRCVEIYAAAHIASAHMEAAFAEAEVIKRQEALLFEEELREKEEGERQAAKAEAERERRAKKKERAKRKKEAEREKREAEEAERAQAEEARRAEQQRKQQEAEERRRREEAEREAELQRQRAAAKQAAEAKRQAEAARKAKQQQQEAERQAAAATAAAAKQQQEAEATAERQQQAEAAAAVDEPAGSSRSSSSCSEEEAPLSSRAASVVSDGTAGSAGPSTRGVASPVTSAATSRAATPEAGGGLAAGSSAADTPLGPPLGGEGSGPLSGPLSASDGGSELSTDDEVEALRRHMAWLESQVANKDAAISALTARVADLESQLVASAAGRSSSGGPPAASSRPAAAGGTAGGSAAPLRPASAGAQPRQHRRSMSGDRPVSPPNAAEAGAINGDLPSSSGQLGAPAAAAAAMGNGLGSLGRLPGQLGGLLPQSPSGAILASASLAAAGAGGRPGVAQQGTAAAAGSARHLPAMNPAAQQFSPAASSSYGGVPKQQLASKRTGYAAAAAGEPTGGPANGSAAYRGSMMGMSSSGRASADAILLASGGGAGTSGERLYGRPSVVLPHAGESGGARAFSTPLPGSAPGGKAAALESPGFDDFAHMGLISDLLE